MVDIGLFFHKMIMPSKIYLKLKLRLYFPKHTHTHTYIETHTYIHTGTVTHRVNIRKKKTFLLLPLCLCSSLLYHVCKHSSVIDRQTQTDSCWEESNDEARSAAISLAIGSVPQYSADGTRSEESTTAHRNRHTHMCTCRHIYIYIKYFH